MNTQDVKAIWEQIINNCQSLTNSNSQGQLKQELMTLVHGNTATANRLVTYSSRSLLRQQNAGFSSSYY